jgi:hypothetical protein
MASDLRKHSVTRVYDLSTALSEPIILDVNPEFEALIDGFALSLRAENKAPRTVGTYIESVTQFAI